MLSDEDRLQKHTEYKSKRWKRIQRQRSAIAKDLLTPKYKQKKIDPKRREDEDERRLRRYGIDLDESI